MRSQLQIEAVNNMFAFIASYSLEKPNLDESISSL